MSHHTQLPKDPAILLSFVNTKLRDDFQSLDDFCKCYDIEASTIEMPLQVLDYSYDRESNQFI